MSPNPPSLIVSHLSLYASDIVVFDMLISLLEQCLHLVMSVERDKGRREWREGELAPVPGEGFVDEVIVIEKKEAGKLRMFIAASFVLHIQVQGVYHTC